jgi:hypothetical protein
MCRLCETGKRVASLNGYCEKCWGDVFGNPNWKDENYKAPLYTVDENGQIVLVSWMREAEDVQPLDETEIEMFQLITESRY